MRLSRTMDADNVLWTLGARYLAIHSRHEYSFAFFVHQVVIADGPSMTKIYYYILHILQIDQVHSPIRFTFMLCLSLRIHRLTAQRCCSNEKIHKWKIVSPFHRPWPFNPSFTIFALNLFSFRWMRSPPTIYSIFHSVVFRCPLSMSTPHHTSTLTHTHFIYFLLHPFFVS